MPDIAEAFAAQSELSQRTSFISGATLAYRDVMEAIAAAYRAGDASLDQAFSDIREQWQELSALIAVEEVL